MESSNNAIAISANSSAASMSPASSAANALSYSVIPMEYNVTAVVGASSPNASLAFSLVISKIICIGCVSTGGSSD